MKQELPLTAAMTAYARPLAYSRDSAIQTTVLALALAAIIPTSFSIVFWLLHRPLNYITPLIWAVFLGLGGALWLGMMHDARLFSRDLASGVYVRWTGSFTTRLISNRYGANTVQVRVGGRKLQNAIAVPLYEIREGTGTVDYLPVSGTLIEVSNESGRVIWSRLPA